MRRLPTETDVLIVGAGPTGLALAISLQQAGIRNVLIDKLPAAQGNSRAAVIHAHTLEELTPLGVVPEMVARGLKIPQFGIRDRDRLLLGIRFDRLPSPHPYLLMLPQNITELILSRRLGQIGGSIHRGVAALNIEQNPQSALASVETDAGPLTINARYVVGADGMQSVVRSAAGIEFAGDAYADSLILADVQMSWPLGNSEVSLYFSPQGMVVVAPLPNGTYRVVATCDPAPEHPSVSDVQGILDARISAKHQVRVQSVVWSSRFRIHHRVAQHYRNGRLLVMGDAAHVHSPAGGQGMNTGLVDAVVLGKLLSRAIASGTADQTLATYEQLRRPAAAQVVQMASRLTSMATARSASVRAMRNLLLSAVDKVPPARRRFTMNLSGLSRKQLARA
jgi:2-polyprenyl-6-methoxyphenol hydroxylase-like FAD-dependent oxidoreductase